MTSLERELSALGKAAPPTAEVSEQLAGHVALLLGRHLARGKPDMRTVSVVPIAKDGKVLLLKRSPERGGFWQPVTGRIEPGETPQAAAERELFEETGLRVPVRPLEYRHGFALAPGLNRVREGALVVVEEVAFVAQVPEVSQPRLSGEHTEHAWFALEQALLQIPFAGLRKAVKLAVSLTGSGGVT